MRPNKSDPLQVRSPQWETCGMIGMTRRLTAVIADDHQIVREGPKVALPALGVVTDEAVEVVAESANGMEAIVAVKV